MDKFSKYQLLSSAHKSVDPSFFVADRPSYGLDAVVDFDPIQDQTSDHPILDVIFAPDPVTGNPRSDLSISLTADTSPVVRDFIERVLRTRHPSVTGAPNDEVAFDLIKPRSSQYGVELSNYLESLRSMVLPKPQTLDAVDSNISTVDTTVEVQNVN